MFVTRRTRQRQRFAWRGGPREVSFVHCDFSTSAEWRACLTAANASPAITINQLLADLPTDVLSHPYFATKRVIPLSVIQPKHAIGVDITSFNQADIRAMVEQGRADADRVLSLARAA